MICKVGDYDFAFDAHMMDSDDLDRFGMYVLVDGLSL
jgi:hypothetical protein